MRSTFFNTWFADCEGFFEIRLFRENRPIHWEFFTSVKSLSNYDYPADCDCYFSVCPRINPKGEKRFIRQVPGLWLDIDCGENGHKKKPRYATIKEAAKELLKEIPHHPDYVMSTGGGIHAYWKFREPFEITSDADIERIEGNMKGMAIRLGADYTSDLSRILRIPDTFNNKQKDCPRECKIIYPKEQIQSDALQS